MKKKHYAAKKNQIKNYQSNWITIRNMIKNKKEKSEHDYFEESKPIFQEMLAEKDQISRKIVDYSNFTQVKWDELNWRSSFDCFHGILFYIFYNSESKFNPNELEIHFSCANLIHNLNPKFFQMPNITNLYDFDDVKKNLKVVQLKMPFLALNF